MIFQINFNLKLQFEPRSSNNSWKLTSFSNRQTIVKTPEVEARDFRAGLDFL